MSETPDRIHLPNVDADTYIRREMIERECRSIRRDDVLGWFDDEGEFWPNPKMFPPTHRKIEYRRESFDSDWFVRVTPPPVSDLNTDDGE
jgi:hypothetical protein